MPGGDPVVGFRRCRGGVVITALGQLKRDEFLLAGRCGTLDLVAAAGGRPTIQATDERVLVDAHFGDGGEHDASGGIGGHDRALTARCRRLRAVGVVFRGAVVDDDCDALLARAGFGVAADRVEVAGRARLSYGLFVGDRKPPAFD